MNRSHRTHRWGTLSLLLSILPGAVTDATPPLDAVLRAEAQRIEMIERVSPSVVCVFDPRLRGGGSGVLIDPEGYGITNFHVVAGLLEQRKGWGGLGDGIRYGLEVLGIDVTGDVAMFRLIPPREGYRFPFAQLGDSDTLHVGNTVEAMGNPFILSEDYSPTVTMGVVTGIHRYQQGVRGNLVYTDCIQVDAAINPGNSGGPLFNAAGQVVGINGRISVNTRGRFNVGFGYAISINQIKRFIPALRAGLLARHGTWQARVIRTGEGNVVFSDVKQPGPAYDAGIRVGHRLLSMDGTKITSANQVASLLGTYPAHWPVLLEVERDGQISQIIVRLEPIQPRLQRPFKVDRSVNLRQVKRVLRQFQHAVFGDNMPARPARWQWTVVRHHKPGADGTTSSPERFEASMVAEGPMRMQQRFEDGSAGRLIEIDARKATQRGRLDTEPFPLSPVMQMTLTALYTMQRKLLVPVGDMDLIDVTHVGADLLVARPSPIDQSTGTEITTDIHDRRDGEDPRLLEVLEWTVANHAKARFGFDSESFLLVHITVQDPLSRDEVNIRLGDYRDIGGMNRPDTIDVQGDGWGYRDTMSDWKQSP